MGYDFQGIYNIWESNLMLFQEENKQKISRTINITELNDPRLIEFIGESASKKIKEEIEIVKQVYPKFNQSDYLDCNSC